MNRPAYRADAAIFANWCVDKHRLAENPFGSLPRADERVDTRRKRRALTEDELVRLLDAARARPLYDALRIRRSSTRANCGRTCRPKPANG